jgi:glutamine---fructose-6-phosphate transaminase (isomerizing)
MKEPGQYLLETIEGQPQEAERLLAAPPAAVAERLRGVGRLFVAGTGTSFHGSLAGQYLLRGAGFEAWAVPAFEFACYPPSSRPDDGLVLLSHRGTKRFSVASLERFRAGSERWVAITCQGSPLAGPGVVSTVPNERSPVHTASHVGAMLRLAQLAAHHADPAATWTGQLPGLPGAIEKAVALRPRVAEALDVLRLERTIHFVGGGPACATALEGALKIREAAYVAAEGHELESVLHGPLASLQRDESAVLVAQPGPSLERTRELAAALGDIGVATVTVGSAAGQVLASARVETPLLDEVLAPIVNVIPLQWLAYEASRRRGVDADSFRRDVPAYAAAQRRFTL